MDIALPTTVDAPLLLHRDCLDILRRLPSASVDVVITDPPAGIGFMGKPWDSFAAYVAVTPSGSTVFGRLNGLLAPWAVGFVVFMVDVWVEVDRVLKPGGFVCAWALPKTADLAGLAMRAVGWDVHDSLLHLFGSGMAKAGDLGKKIDAMHGAVREVVGGDPESARRNKRMTDGATYDAAIHPLGECPLTAPATTDAKHWTDWSSQLAPGHEQWLLARKPTPLTYAKQVLALGCGAMNIGAGRVPRGESTSRPSWTDRGVCGDVLVGGGGSWPKNVLLTEGGEGCPVVELDRQSGARPCAGNKTPTTMGELGVTTMGKRAPVLGIPPSYGDGERAASKYFTRFIYTAKNSDRSAGMRVDIINDHPTPKSIDLMRWIVRLLAAKAEHTGGLPAIVLDPFMGSGSTGVACIHEQVRFVGIERDEKSHAIARARIMAAIGSPDAAAEANDVAPTGAQLALL
jgi:DNA modification methylase